MGMTNEGMPPPRGDGFRFGESAGSRVDAVAARKSALDDLTPREREVLGVLAVGQSNRMLARRLGIAERTVKAHLTSITRKLGLRSRVEAVLLSIEWADHLHDTGQPAGDRDRYRQHGHRGGGVQ